MMPSPVPTRSTGWQAFGAIACCVSIIGAPALGEEAGRSPDPTAAHGMVTGTTGSIAIEAGVDMLRQGGSAADAAMATATTQVCMAAGSWVSYAGIMTMVYYDAATGKTYDMNAGFNTIRGEKDPRSIPGWDLKALGSKGLAAAAGAASGRTALVPGFMAGVEAAHTRFGKLPLGNVLAPAIRCAEEGIPWSKGLAAQFAFREPVLNRLPATKAIFQKSDGSRYAADENFKQTELARTLRAASHGIRNYLYTGPWAKQLVAAVQRDGGKMTLEDLAKYKVSWNEPVSTHYHGYEVFVHGLPATGGVSIVEGLNLADAAGLSAMGQYCESPQALFWLAQIVKPQILFSPNRPEDRDRAAAALGIDLSLQSRLKPETAAKLWQAIKAGQVQDISLPRELPAHSDAVVAVDQWGNIAAVTHTINTVSWGSTGIFVDGVSIPDSAAFQQDSIAQVSPGSRLPDPTNPGLVVKDGKPYMGFSSIGAGLNIRTVEALMEVLDFGLTPQAAIDKPSLGSFKLGDTGENKLEGTTTLTVGAKVFTPQFLQTLRDLGQPVEESDPLRGYWIGIAIDPKTHELHGGEIRELDMGGRAVGY